MKNSAKSFLRGPFSSHSIKPKNYKLEIDRKQIEGTGAKSQIEIKIFDNGNNLANSPNLIIPYERNINEKLDIISQFLRLDRKKVFQLLLINSTKDLSELQKETIELLYNSYFESTGKKYYIKRFWLEEEAMLNNMSPVNFMLKYGNNDSLGTVLGLFKKSFLE